MFLRLVMLLCFVASFECASVRPLYEYDQDENDFDEDNYHPSSKTLRLVSSYASSNGPELPGPWIQTNWTELAKSELENARQVTENVRVKRAKNVIFFIGDGMGISTLASARLYNAEMKNLRQKDIYLAWERMPHVALSRTYNVDRSTPDSAGTATAYLCGVKANYETIGVSDKVPYDNCTAIKGNEVRSIAKESIALGKWTGVVTTTRITHASPAGAYAHVANRDWEAEIPVNVTNNEDCDDIAKQLITDPENKKTRVILGGGYRMFLPKEVNGSRSDGRNLIKEWIAMRTEAKESHRFVQNLTQFNEVDPSAVDYLLGLFSPDHMDYEVDRMKREPLQQPSLAEMTDKAIRLLRRSPEGYFLFVEGGRIDHSHHDSRAYKALNDTVALSEAVEKAVEMTKDSDDTLIVVSADHSHVFTFGGYASFARSVLDLSDGTVTKDGKPFLQLNYANGPSFPYHRLDNGTEVPRKNLTDVDVMDPEFQQDTGIHIASETHGGEDVAIFATGPMSHLFHGNHEQNYIAHVIMYASCVGAYKNEAHCSTQSTSPATSSFRLSWKHFLPLVISVAMTTALLPSAY